MTHSLNRKKRVNECDDFDDLQHTKRARTKILESSELSDVNDANINFQASDLTRSNSSFSKEQFSRYSATPENNEFSSDISECVQPGMSSVASEYALIHQINFKYLPYLSATENPHYYENNKLLFELYVERLRRSTSHSVIPSHQF